MLHHTASTPTRMPDTGCGLAGARIRPRRLQVSDGQPPCGALNPATEVCHSTSSRRCPALTEPRSPGGRVQLGQGGLSEAPMSPISSDLVHASGWHCQALTALD